MTVLEALKANEKATQHHLVLMLTDEDAQRVLVAWTYYNPKFKDRELLEWEDYKVVVEKVWPKVDFMKLSKDAGVPWKATIEVFERLKHARLIYPDGTAHAEALNLLRGQIGGHIRGLLKKR